MSSLEKINSDCAKPMRVMGRSKIFRIAGAASVVTAMSALALAPATHAQERDRTENARFVKASKQFTRGTNESVAARLLDRHNQERRRLGLSELRWNPSLASDAAKWGKTLSRKGYLQHSDARTRGGAGENLWMGTSGFWGAEGMVDMFLNERKHYRHGAFPHVSRTGNWSDVGHYTQIVWRDTREVGCAVVSGRGNDVLVCRYWPAGNVWGAEPY